MKLHDTPLEEAPAGVQTAGHAPPGLPRRKQEEGKSFFWLGSY